MRRSNRVVTGQGEQSPGTPAPSAGAPEFQTFLKINSIETH